MFQRFLGCAALAATPLAVASGQHDYRNLDAARPVPTEDAYPVERWALEFMLPVHHEREAGISTTAVEPEVMWGAFPDGMLALGVPIGVGDLRGVAGLRPAAMFNFNTESPSVPALALRVDGVIPVGVLGGTATSTTLTALATRSFGLTRLHLNAGVGLGSDAGQPALDPPARWRLGLAVDRTLWRTSTLLIVDLHARRSLGSSVTILQAALGVRRQLTPVLVIDVGAARRLGHHGADLAVTAGLTRSISLAGLGRGGVR